MIDCSNITAVAAVDVAPIANTQIVSDYQTAPKTAYMNAELKIKKDGVKIVYSFNFNNDLV